MWQTIKQVLATIKWLRAQKKQLESNAEAYLSAQRAQAVRLWLERMFVALEEGPANSNYAKLPKIVRWFCGGTNVDLFVGRFGTVVLKSTKLAEGSSLLRKDIEQWDGPAADRGKP